MIRSLLAAVFLLAACQSFTAPLSLPVEMEVTPVQRVIEPGASAGGGDGLVRVTGEVYVLCTQVDERARREGRTLTLELREMGTASCDTLQPSEYTATLRDLDAGTYRMRVLHYGELVLDAEVTVQ
jgi:hypothetical protein